MTETIEMNGRAVRTQRPFRLEYRVGIRLRAAPRRVWELMTDAAGFPRWNSTVKSISGRIAAGETIQLVATIAPERTFKLAVTEFSPTKRMVWSEGNAMFKGVRTYTFAAGPGETTDFTMSEVYTGLMLPMIAGSLPDFRETFERYAADLKKEAEK